MATRRRGFGTIDPERSGRYTARYADPEGRMRTTRHGNTRPVFHRAPRTFDTRGDAEAWLADERRLISAGTWSPPADRQRAALLAETAREHNTFAPYARAWLAGRHELRASTRASYTTAIERHLIPTFGETHLSDITVPAVRAWFASYGDRTPTARAHAYQVLGAIMAQAEDDELITRSPVRIKAGGRSKVRREPEVLTRAELFALADAMPEKHRALTLICGLCGLRFGEAVALRRRDIDLEARTIAVARTAIRADGKKVAGPPKTAAGRRTVAMPPSVAEALREHLKSQPVSGRDALIFPGANGELLAPTALYGREARTERRGGKTYVKKAYGFFAAREAIGRPDLNWHDLRRTAATLGAQAGATVREMQHRLGHATGDMALYYQRATADRDRAIADALDAVPGNDEPTPLRATTRTEAP
ncbi:tyrosine-type recombinase/integrase [Janibacter hoylei]|uniref:tyrosine-type recombinase/integrase n=1 Tax=Janibacter hoylei TaxID=364298 RepID=UPI0021A4B30A|nr:site-specific integrase [Janibacter hoylei]MCT1617655.1 site-specific integrase [Janibacter hoylei]MCT2291822.1 site-specific integrase [Janibacter hoylei]